MSFRVFAHKCASSLSTLPKYSTQSRNMSVHKTKQFQRLKEMQVAMQCDDGVPVYLKRGTRDKVLLGITYFLLAIGCVDALRFVWRGVRKL